MANYATLKAAISQVIKENGNKEITGAIMQTTLLAMVDSMSSGYTFVGVATPTTSAGTPDENVFWIGGSGSYSNFGATTINVPTGCICIFTYNGSFASSILYVGGVVDISKLTNTSYESLSQALADVPSFLQVGGLEVMYQDSTSGNFVKCRLMNTSWSTTITDWQGVDKVPIAGSRNLVESGGVNKSLIPLNGTISKKGYYLNSTGGEVPNDNWGISVLIPVTQGETYTWIAPTTGSYVDAKACTYMADGVTVRNYYTRANTVSITIGAYEAFLKVSFNMLVTGSMVKQGNEIIWEPETGALSRIAILEDEVRDIPIDFYNVTVEKPLESGYYTLSTAIAAVPENIRKKGFVIMYEEAENSWRKYYYSYNSTAQSAWTNTFYWLLLNNTFLYCQNQYAINFDLANKKLKTNQYADTILIWDGGSYTIPRGSVISIENANSAYMVLFNIKNNTFSTVSVNGANLSPKERIFAIVSASWVSCFATPNYYINGNPSTISNPSKGDVGYVVNVGGAIFDTNNHTLNFNQFDDAIYVFANGRSESTTIARDNPVVLQLDTTRKSVILFDYADKTFKTLVSSSAYTAPSTSVLVGWYDPIRKAAFFNGRFTIRGQHDYWDYSDLQTWLKDGISAHIQKVSQSVVDNSLIFDFITDVQTDQEYNGCLYCYTEALFAAMKCATFTVNGGDLVSGGNLHLPKDNIAQMAKMYLASKKDKGCADIFMCQGNHDGGWYNWNTLEHHCKAEDVITDKTWYNMFLKNIQGAVYDATNPMGGYLYKDFEEYKIRIIVLNSVDVNVYDNDGYIKYNPMYKSGVRQQQLDWLVNYALDFSNKGDDKTNWGIIVFSHFGVDVDNDSFSNASIVESVLQAFKSGTSINQTSGTIGDDFYLTVNHDFALQGAMNYIAYIHGHTHTDRVLFNFGVPHIATAAAAPYENETPPVGGTTTDPRTAGTIREFCWDTMQYNKEDTRIVAYRFGAGNDRYIKLGVNNVSVNETITLTTSLSGTITWTIYAQSSANIASISNGVVTGIASGNATACAEDENGVKEFFSIVVS